MKADVRNGVVYLGEGELDPPIELTPAEAAALGSRLGQAAHLGWQQLQTIAAACEDGHDWGPPYNGWLGGHHHVTVELCQRPGCHERQLSQGWMPFAARSHWHPLGSRQLVCTGPGCVWCDEDKLAEQMRQALQAGMSAIDKAALGEPVG